MLLQGLKMVVLPLIIFSIISGIAALDGKTTGRLGGYAVAYYGVTTILAVIIGIIMSATIKPGVGDNDDEVGCETFKGSSDQSHFIFAINVGKSRILHRTTLKLNSKIDSKSIEDGFIQIQSRSMSDPILSDIDFSNTCSFL